MSDNYRRSRAFFKPSGPGVSNIVRFYPAAYLESFDSFTTSGWRSLCRNLIYDFFRSPTYWCALNERAKWRRSTD